MGVTYRWVVGVPVAVAAGALVVNNEQSNGGELDLGGAVGVYPVLTRL